MFVLVGPAGAATPAVVMPGVLQEAFTAAAQRYHVPIDVLLAVSYIESRWDAHAGRPSVSGGYGPMHLTDLRAALAQSHSVADDRDDTAGSSAKTPDPSRTAALAASLTGLPEDRIRLDPAANIAGGAALLATDQETLGQPLTSDPADWYGAVARYSGSGTQAAAADFADEVFDVIRSGEAHTTDSGQRVALAAQPAVASRTAQVRALDLPAGHSEHTECPSSVRCTWISAPYEQYGPEPTDYGNHDLAERPKESSIAYIVIHTTESTWDDAIRLVKEPTYLGWHYTVRSSDGAIAQHLATKDVGWHAGNWYINAKAIGIEHEAFLADPDAWFTEAMYRSSARLVRYLAHRFRIPLDRQHIIGHDNVPGLTPDAVAGMHTDPGPYWDWAHYFRLLGVPFHATAGSGAGVVTIDPSYSRNEPAFTGCVSRDEPCAAHGSSALLLHMAPSDSAPLVNDVGLHPNGQSTTDVNDTGARVSAGQQYVVAARRGEWTAIWYLGRKAWLRDPHRRRVTLPARAMVATPRRGLASIPVYGGAFPEASTFPTDIPVPVDTTLQYRLPAGQSYVVGGKVTGEYYYSTTYKAPQTWVRGTKYYEIQFGQRLGFVRASDVTLHPLR
ncbi:N-acetylmuramoyl-L-alanine amidase [Pseudonocardia sp. CA-142604]|uniref:N-acetylmuramoyl-L-alanine amidase n=1 Tax=Pseudonocardia sp. CA-142604 TaxID=3240024 RepID=UPI003D8A18BE